MPVTRLDHYFVRANDLEVTREFYCDVLGFEVMPRPAFPFPGYWLGVGGAIQVHMGPHGIEHSDVYYLGTTPQSSTTDAGVIDHIAFGATDPEGFYARFQQLGLPCRKRFFAEIGLCQLFVKDPNELTIELNFHGLSAEPNWGATEHYSDMPTVERAS